MPIVFSNVGKYKIVFLFGFGAIIKNTKTGFCLTSDLV